MAITIANAFMNAVRYELNDNGTTKQWSDAELLSYYNIFVTAVISEYPRALTKTIQWALAAGVEQRLETVPAADAVSFIRMPANATGEGIEQVTAEAMQDSDPNWYAAPPTKVVQCVIPDPDEVLACRVYPPNDGTGVVNQTYSYAPPDATAVTDNFTLTEAWRLAAMHAVLGCALLKNTPRGDRAKSAFHFGQFDAAVSKKVQADVATKPVAAKPDQSSE